ncbi:MAG: hypothetical protein AAF727_09850 [Pseudomonadota bacterium]
MTLIFAITALAILAGAIMPVAWGTFGFVTAAAFLFALQAGINTALGFDGTSIEESLLLFNNDWTSYIGFNLQITYRAFALPLLALAAPLIWRYARGSR